MLSQTNWIPDEGRQVLSSLTGAFKNERDRCKVYMEEGFSVLEKYLAQNTKNAPARSDETVTEVKTAAVEEVKAPDAQGTEQSTK